MRSNRKVQISRPITARFPRRIHGSISSKMEHLMKKKNVLNYPNTFSNLIAFSENLVTRLEKKKPSHSSSNRYTSNYSKLDATICHFGDTVYTCSQTVRNL